MTNARVARSSRSSGLARVVCHRWGAQGSLGRGIRGGDPAVEFSKVFRGGFQAPPRGHIFQQHNLCHGRHPFEAAEDETNDRHVINDQRSSCPLESLVGSPPWGNVLRCGEEAKCPVDRCITGDPTGQFPKGFRGGASELRSRTCPKFFEIKCLQKMS